MRCWICKEIVDSCRQCGKLFKVDDMIFCLEDDDGCFHFCSIKCARITSKVIK